MKTFSPVAVALVSSCLVFFHSNPAFAAIIDIDAGAPPPEDAALAPLDEPDDGTAAAAATSVIDATPAEAASVPNRRRRTLTGKKTGGGTPPTPAPPTPAPPTNANNILIVEEDIVDDILYQVYVENACKDDVWFRESWGPKGMKIPAYTSQFYNNAGDIHTTDRFSFAKWDCFTWNDERRGTTDRTCINEFLAILEMNLKGQEVKIGSPIPKNTGWNFNAQYGFINLNMEVLVTTFDDVPSCATPGGKYVYDFNECNTIGRFVPSTGITGNFPTREGSDGICYPPNYPPEGNKLCELQEKLPGGKNWQETLRKKTFTEFGREAYKGVEYPNCINSVTTRPTTKAQTGFTQGCANSDATYYCNPDSPPWPQVGFLFGCDKPQQKISVYLTCDGQ